MLFCAAIVGSVLFNSLPASLTRALPTSFPGLHASALLGPTVVRADLDGDEQSDFALLLDGALTGERIVVVAMRRGDGWSFARLPFWEDASALPLLPLIT